MQRMKVKEISLTDEVKVLINPPKVYWKQMEFWYSLTERWNFRPDDFQLWRNTYESFWLYTAIDKKTEELVGTVSVAMQRDSNKEPIYSVGLFYCVPKYRGLGISKKLFELAKQSIGNHNVFLFGVEAMSNWYATRQGFSLVTDFWYFWAVADSRDIVVPENLSDEYTVKEIDNSSWDALHEYDAGVCTVQRQAFMKANLTWPSTISRIIVDKNGKTSGFGCIRLVTNDELLICPLYANNVDAATKLLSTMLSAVPNLSTRGDLTMCYPEANPLVVKMLSAVTNGRFSANRMYRLQFTKKSLPIAIDRVFATDENSHSLT